MSCLQFVRKEKQKENLKNFTIPEHHVEFPPCASMCHYQAVMATQKNNRGKLLFNRWNQKPVQSYCDVINDAGCPDVQKTRLSGRMHVQRTVRTRL